jgi:hypothetical protein
MSSILLEVIFDASDYSKMGIDGRDDIEDPLAAALMNAGIGEITGGGSGSGSVIVDIEIEREDNLNEALRVIRKILRNVGSPKSTIIKRSKPSEMIYAVYED